MIIFGNSGKINLYIILGAPTNFISELKNKQKNRLYCHLSPNLILGTTLWLNFEEKNHQ